MLLLVLVLVVVMKTLILLLIADAPGGGGGGGFELLKPEIDQLYHSGPGIRFGLSITTGFLGLPGPFF
jgi:hypothetical protein